MRGLISAMFLVTAALLAGAGAAAHAELRISDLDVFLNDHEVTVQAVTLGTVPPGIQESVQSGLPTNVRFTFELWQYTRFWRDRLLATKMVERQLTYNVVSKEYKVAFLKGDSRPVYATRDLRDAQRVLSDVRIKLMPAASLDPEGIIYVRMRSEAAVNGENTFFARMAGMAEETQRQSDYRMIMRIH